MHSRILKSLISAAGLGGLLAASLLVGSPTLPSASADPGGECHKGMSPEARTAIGLSAYHSLNLSPEQAASLAAILGPYQDAVAGPRGELDDLRAQMDKIYSGMEKDLKKTGEPSAADQSKLEALHTQVQPLRDEVRDLSRSAGKAAMAVLTDEQRTLLKDYHPAVALGGMDAPPRRGHHGGMGPEGERGGDDRLERLRTADMAQIEQRTAHMAERAVENGVPQAEAQARSEAFLAIAAEIKGLSDAEWAASKDAYRERIKTEVGRPGGGRGHKGGMEGGQGRHGAKGDKQAHKAARILLSPEFYETLSDNL